jgi:nucleotide-binding universal stress UspA family protein
MKKMAKRILAPIDGREESEAIVPIVRALARGDGSTVRLLRVYPVPEHVVGPHGRTIAYSDQEMARLTNEGHEGFAHIEAELGHVPVASVVRFGDAREEILLEAEAFGADLIALVGSKDGRVRSVFAPGIAERIAHEAPIPTLVLRP